MHMYDSAKDTSKPYDFELRARKFALDVRGFLKRLPRTVSVYEDGRQLIRSSGSIGANFIEAQESLGKKNCIMHLKIARKEAKESIHWLSLLTDIPHKEAEVHRQRLTNEAKELMYILCSMLKKTSSTYR